VRGECEIAVLTRSEDGSLIVTATEAIPIKPQPVAQVIDVTGAGDLYAAGFLYGLTRSLPLAVCGRLGSLAAAEVIGHIGARPETPLAALARKEGLIA
jgi:sugar/nucleoside kinase (ribokinase family)